MKRLLLIDPIYNPGNIPPSVTLGKLEAMFGDTLLELELIDFVEPTCEYHDIKYFREKEAYFFNLIREKACNAHAIYIAVEHGNEFKPYPVFPRIREIAAAAKQGNNSIKVIVGGALINLMTQVHCIPEYLIQDQVIDVIAKGSAVNIARAIASVLDLNIIIRPGPSKWKLWDWSKYPKYASVNMKTGCPFKCDFCFEGKIFDKKNLSETISSLTETIWFLRNNHDIRQIMFEDSILLSYKEFFDIAAMLSDLDVSFANYARVSEIIAYPEKIFALKASGGNCLVVGFETVDDGILANTNKKIIATQSRQALAICKEIDIDIQGCFMLGFPQGGMIDSERTIDFALSENLNCNRWHVFMPDYRNMDGRFYTDQTFTVADILNTQVNVPDRTLPEIISENPRMILIEEHFLIRALPYLEDTLILEKSGYADLFNLEELYRLMQSKLIPAKLPLNEDCMYERLFKRA
jgi:hypothetical protein